MEKLESNENELKDLAQVQQLEVVVKAVKPWVATQVAIRPGQTILIRVARGQWTANPNTGYYDGEGIAIAAKDGYALAGVAEGSLIVKIGTSGQPTFAGNYKKINGNVEQGEIYLTINDDLENRYGRGFADNRGELVIELSNSTP